MTMRAQLEHPKRSLGLTSADNVRDIGGYTTADGRETKWRRFVRSGDMDRMTSDDQAELLAYGVTTVIDLRMAKELAALPNVFSQSKDVAFVNHDFWGTRFDDYRSWRKGASVSALSRQHISAPEAESPSIPP